MSTTPISDAASVSDVPGTGEASFNKAVEQAEQNELSPELVDMMVEGAITIGGQMILMPRATEILGEVMSDE